MLEKFVLVGSLSVLVIGYTSDRPHGEKITKNPERY